MYGFKSIYLGGYGGLFYYKKLYVFYIVILCTFYHCKINCVGIIYAIRIHLLRLKCIGFFRHKNIKHICITCIIHHNHIGTGIMDILNISSDN